MPPSAAPPSAEVYLLPLDDAGAPQIPHEYVYLPAPKQPAYTLRLEIEGSASVCRQGVLYTNIPAVGQKYKRDAYRSFPLRPDFTKTITIDLPITCAGAFSFYTTYTPLPDLTTADKSTPAPAPTRTPTYYVNVEPCLLLQGTRLPLDALSIFSVVSRFMGAYPQQWQRHLAGVAARNYNMVHFTPLVARGSSDSPYSLYDQLQFDRATFSHGESDIAELVKGMEGTHGLLGLTDVVWNHTANNSKWLEEHPEAGYNVQTAPWMEAALELDTALLEFGDRLESLGLPTELHDAGDLSRIIAGMQRHVVEPLNLWQYFVIDVDKAVDEALAAWSEGKTVASTSNSASSLPGLESAKQWSREQQVDFIRQNGLVGASTLGPRYSRRVRPEVAAALLRSLYRAKPTDTQSSDARQLLVHIIDDLNVPLYAQYNDDVKTIAQQVFDRVRYLRLDSDGPRLGKIGGASPLIETYFTRLPDNATTRQHDPTALALANNGWIWAANAMQDHAGPQSRAYLRREVIVWSDCVKLRYGKSRSDNVFLWDYMAAYTRLMAKYFTSFRIDNCHSTPIHVAEYLLDEARSVRPDLAVFAELFTGSEEMDYVFVKRLGISALIREAMQAGSTQEMSRYVHMHAGRPIGSFDSADVEEHKKHDSVSTDIGQHGDGKHRVERLCSSPLHALFMDCTHDNEMPAQKRDARDTLPNAALVSMCASATGSVMGYDEVYPRNVNIVQDSREYTSAASDVPIIAETGEGGIAGVKRLLNKLHTQMGQEGYEETFLHHEGEFITVHRQQPLTRMGYFLATHTAYPGSGPQGHGILTPVHLAGSRARQIGCWKLEVDDSEDAKKACADDPKLLKGLPSKVVTLEDAAIESNGDDTTLRMPAYFPPGSIALFETWMPAAEHAEGLDRFVALGADTAINALNLLDLNFLLYRCDAEEQDSSAGKIAVYTIPSHGPLVYAGLQGWWSVLEPCVRANDLGAPVCKHLRSGAWALDFIVTRLRGLAFRHGRDGLLAVADWFASKFAAMKALPSFLRPRYFALAVQAGWKAATAQCVALMSSQVVRGPRFLHRLALTSVQMTGTTTSASLEPLESTASLAAGLPHFATSWARCWGRDIFIALRGLYLGTGRFHDAEQHIKAFAAVMKHGMVPNLLGNGETPRYNARDAVWFFLQNIQDYTVLAPHGLALLGGKVKRRFLPYDDTFFDVRDERAYSKDSTIAEIIQEAMQRHASGLSFREHNAGPQLDMQMQSAGFQIDVFVDWQATGFVFGGNQFNCGTWMDKMGESSKAGNKGVPGTPRDGAAIELTGLLYSTLSWLTGLHAKGAFPHAGVTKPDGTTVMYADWAKQVKTNFERCYYIPLDPAEDAAFDVNPAVVNRRGIYKDLYRSGKEYEDYQLRANFPIAMTVAPDLFTPARAMHALGLADTVLRGPLGMATLDPSDLNYRPYYDNSNDSDDFAVAKGRNYHQGPEWVWPTGFFLRALLKFDLLVRGEKGKVAVDDKAEALQQVARRLAGCKQAIETSPWAGLPELTNKDGEFCRDSCPTQAWSTGCLIDLYMDAGEMS